MTNAWNYATVFTPTFLVGLAESDENIKTAFGLTNEELSKLDYAGTYGETPYVDLIRPVIDPPPVYTYADVFPDPNFRSDVIRLVFNGEREDSSPVTEGDRDVMAAVTSLYLDRGFNDDDYIKIRDLTGIECFKGLSSLSLGNNLLESVDFSQNPALQYLNCDNNQLNELDVSNNPALAWLNCSHNQLNELDVSNNTSLQVIERYHNQLSELDVSNAAALQYLYCHDNQLKILDISNNTSLQNLYCYNNYMGEDPDIVKGWHGLGLVINSPSNLYSGTFLFYNQLQQPAVDCQISASHVKGRAGETVMIPVMLEYNPGMMSLRLGIKYDTETLELESVTSELDVMLYTPSKDLSDNPYKALWISNTFLNNNSNGVILNLEFTILSGAADGVYQIELTYDPSNTYDENNSPIEIRLVDGSVEVVSYQYGDADDNGVITSYDAILTLRYVNGWDMSASSFIAESGRTLEARFTPVQLSDDAYSLSGQIRTYSPGYPAIVKLMQGDKEIDKIDIPVDLGSGQRGQNFEFKDVTPGTYSLVITKDGHTKFTVQSIVIDDKNVNLTEDSRSEVRLMTMRCGDLKSDGVIDDRDLTNLWLSANYFKNTLQAANPLCDINSDGVIDDRDLTILWMTYNYYRGEIVIQ